MSGDIETVRVHTRYEWDCPGCGDVVNEGDVEPASGVVITCDCGREVVPE